MKDQILKYFYDCRMQYIRHMSDMEIYEYICNIFDITDFKEARECSFILYNEVNK